MWTKIKGTLCENLHFFNTLLTNVNMDTFELKVTHVYMFGLFIMLPCKPRPLINVIFLVAMVNFITNAADVPMLTFGTTVIKVINVNWFP